MNKELLKGLTEELIEKVNACKSNEEILALAKEEGIELTDEQLNAINGGGCNGGNPPCPKCYSVKTEWLGGNQYKCKKCKKIFED